MLSSFFSEGFIKFIIIIIIILPRHNCVILNKSYVPFTN